MPFQRMAEFEGGPDDGVRRPVDVYTSEVAIAMGRGTPVDCTRPPGEALAPLLRIGIYRRDPLDFHTMIWEGEQ